MITVTFSTKYLLQCVFCPCLETTRKSGMDYGPMNGRCAITPDIIHAAARIFFAGHEVSPENFELNFFFFPETSPEKHNDAHTGSRNCITHGVTLQQYKYKAECIHNTNNHSAAGRSASKR